MADSQRVEQLVEKIARLSDLQLDEVERLVGTLSASTLGKTPVQPNFSWPHAPTHRLTESGAYIVTGATYLKQHYWRSRESLDQFQASLLECAQEYGWHLEAWACFSNHYHFVAKSPANPGTLPEMVKRLHASTAKKLNERDDQPGRQVWYNYWETHLSFQKSYLVRLCYVHNNPVRHGLVSKASQYRWCSAGWFEQTASPSQVKTIYALKTDRVNVLDDFDVLLDA